MMQFRLKVDDEEGKDETSGRLKGVGRTESFQWWPFECSCSV